MERVITGTLKRSKTSEPARKFYRVKTDREIYEQQIAVPGHGQFYEAGRGPDWRAGMPAVFWLFGYKQVQFTEAQQRLAWDMVKDIMNTSKWAKVYGDDKAFMNNTGFWHSTSPYEYDPRRNYITGENMDKPLPAWDKIRVCANATISGVKDGDMLIVDTISPDAIPTWAELKPKKWLYFEAVSSTKTGDTTPFPQGGGYPVYIPLIAETVVKFPLSALEEL